MPAPLYIVITLPGGATLGAAFWCDGPRRGTYWYTSKGRQYLVRKVFEKWVPAPE